MIWDIDLYTNNSSLKLKTKNPWPSLQQNLGTETPISLNRKIILKAPNTRNMQLTPLPQSMFSNFTLTPIIGILQAQVNFSISMILCALSTKWSKRHKFVFGFLSKRLHTNWSLIWLIYYKIFVLIFQCKTLVYISTLLIKMI